MTYDGSRKAAGVQVYVDGKAEPLDVTNDTLQRHDPDRQAAAHRPARGVAPVQGQARRRPGLRPGADRRERGPARRRPGPRAGRGTAGRPRATSGRRRSRPASAGSTSTGSTPTTPRLKAELADIEQAAGRAGKGAARAHGHGGDAEAAGHVRPEARAVRQAGREGVGRRAGGAARRCPRSATRRTGSAWPAGWSTRPTR